LAGVVALEKCFLNGFLSIIRVMDDAQKELLKSVIKRYYEVNHNSLKMILDHCGIRNLKGDEYLLKEGKSDGNEYFLLEGLMQRNILNHKGENITTGFYLTGTVLTPHFARTINGKSIFNIQALTDASLAELPVEMLDSLRFAYSDIRSFGLKVLERELLNSLSSEVSHRSMNAKDRLIAMRKNYPNLENMIPHTIIASFIGITPVSFSRLRHELSRH
jgi:CRP-like cAMP-binding protein